MFELRVSDGEHTAVNTVTVNVQGSSVSLPVAEEVIPSPAVEPISVTPESDLVDPTPVAPVVPQSVEPAAAAASEESTGDQTSQSDSASDEEPRIDWDGTEDLSVLDPQADLSDVVETAGEAREPIPDLPGTATNNQSAGVASAGPDAATDS